MKTTSQVLFVIAVGIVAGVIILNVTGHAALAIALWLLTLSMQIALGALIGSVAYSLLLAGVKGGQGALGWLRRRGAIDIEVEEMAA